MAPTAFPVGISGRVTLNSIGTKYGDILLGGRYITGGWWVEMYVCSVLRPENGS